MAEPFKPLFDRSFLASELAYEYERFKETDTETELVARLRNWNARTVLGESEIEAAFIGRFFEDTWGYRPDGHGSTWTLQQQFATYRKDLEAAKKLASVGDLARPEKLDVGELARRTQRPVRRLLALRDRLLG